MSEPPIHIEGTIRGDVTGGDKTVIQRAGGDIVGRDKITRDAPPIGVAALHQLPAPPSDFVGRKSELRELSRAVQSRGLAISGLRGMGGVGKTALALKLAEQLKPHYPDAQFFIRLEGLSDAPVDPLEAIGHVIRAYEPTAQLPESLDDRRAQYLALLGGKRALLVLDDVRDPAQVLPLVPPAGCLLLVTSRQFFTLPGWQARDIGLLSAAEARRLLRKIAPRIKSWADEIAKLCGYHPLALRAAGGLLAATPDLETDQFAKDLQAEQARLTLIGPRAEGVEINIEALFNLSYAQLTPDAARVFRRLAIFPDDFDAQAGETVCDDAGHAQLSELVRRSLVEFSRKRYRLHDLARAFAGSRLRDAERADAQRRHGVHYKDILAAADDLYLAGEKISFSAWRYSTWNVPTYWPARPGPPHTPGKTTLPPGLPALLLVLEFMCVIYANTRASESPGWKLPWRPPGACMIAKRKASTWATPTPTWGMRAGRLSITSSDW